MFLLIREILGWLLLGMGLVLIWFVFILAMNRSVLEAMALSLPSVIVFRAGIGFIKMTTAGRIAADVVGEVENGNGRST